MTDNAVIPDLMRADFVIAGSDFVIADLIRNPWMPDQVRHDSDSEQVRHDSDSEQVRHDGLLGNT